VTGAARELPGGPVGPVLRDRHVIAAFAAGPLCWTLLWAFGLPLADGTPATMTLAYGVVVYPLLEEIVFRGALQGTLLGVPALARRRLGLSGANVLASIAFAAAHLWSQPPSWAAAVLVPSLVFGHVYERHRRVGPAFALHAFYNAGFLLLFVGAHA